MKFHQNANKPGNEECFFQSIRYFNNMKAYIDHCDKMCEKYPLNSVRESRNMATSFVRRFWKNFIKARPFNRAQLAHH